MASPVIQLSPRVVAARMNGSKGGKATARKYAGTSFLTERAEQGGRAVRDRYGADYYPYIRKLVKKPGPRPKFKPQ